MRLWLLILLVCVVQESASTNAVLLTAYQEHYPLLIIHLLFALGTMFDIGLSYWIGKFVYRKFPNGRILSYVQKVAANLETTLGKRGELLGIFLLGIVNFIYLDAFVFAWLPFSFWEIALLLFLGDMCAYAIEWAFVLGVHFFFPDPLSALGVITLLSLIIIIGVRYFSRGPTTRV